MTTATLERRGRTGTAAIQPVRRGRFSWAVADALVLAKRTLIQTPRVPELLVFATIQPVMFVVLFRYVFGGAINVEGTSYVNYLMAGIFVQTIAFGASNTGVSLADDMQKGLIDRFRSLPMAPSAVLMGRTIAELARNTFVVAIMFAVGLLVGFRPDGNPAAWAAALALMLLFSFAMSWIFVVNGLAVRTVEAVQQASFIWLFPLTFVSSAFVPVETMPGWLQPFAEYQPMSQVVDAVRALLLGEPLGSSLWWSLAWCIGLIAVFVPLGISLYQRRTAR
ncbi:MAG: ABC transporter permease [Dehalococcoidia bacterium]